MDISKDTNLTEMEIQAQIHKNDPIWKRKQKLGLVQLMNPTD